MDSIKEGERALLDNSMLTLCLSMMRGHRNAKELPVVMLGHAGWPNSNRPESFRKHQLVLRGNRLLFMHLTR